MARINEARLKKGYIVEGVGAEKKFIPIGKKNTNSLIKQRIPGVRCLGRSPRGIPQLCAGFQQGAVAYAIGP